KGIHVCSVTGDMADDKQEARLVILSPSSTHKARSEDSPALLSAAEILDKRNSSPRTHRNMLLFIATDVELYKALEEETRRYLAWESIVEEADALNLDGHQRSEAERGLERSNETVSTRLNESYCWLLVPTQEGANPMEWEAARIPGGQENPIAKATKKVGSSAQLITKWSPALLRMELDRWLWRDEPHISLKWVWECLTTYIYLPRLRDVDVLIATIREGVRSQDYFGYATSVSEKGRYQGLQFGSAGGTIYLDDQSVLVKPDVAKSQLETEATAPLQAGGTTGSTVSTEVESSAPESGGPYKAPTTSPLEPLAPTLPKRFYGSVELEAKRMARDAGQIAEEVIQHLAGIVGSDIEVILEIHALVPEGVPANVVRVVTENCRTLKFKSYGFEED
ncbi:MAG TPA: hypothetical protein VNO14_00475, partial [Blastocatellia bacterium]|nr:hypothetical protein [Blastocatellia bacterium]